MNSRVDGIGCGFLVTHVTFDGEYIALARKDAARSTVRKIDDADLPSRRDQMAGNGVADALRPTSNQGDGSCRGHVVAIRPVNRVRREDRAVRPSLPRNRR